MAVALDLTDQDEMIAAIVAALEATFVAGDDIGQEGRAAQPFGQREAGELVPGPPACRLRLTAEPGR